MARRPRFAVLVAVLAGVIAAGAVMWFALAASDNQQRVVRVGMYENPPKIYTGPDGRPTGLFPQLLDAMADEEGWDLRYVDCVWETCLRDVETGAIDLMPDVAWSAERDAVMDFPSRSVANSWSQVYVRPDLKVDSLADLSGQRIALLTGGIQEEQFAELMAANGLQFTPVPVDDLESGYRAVEEERADAVITNRFFAAWNADRYRLRESPIVFLPSTLYIATAEGRNADLLAGVDRWISTWKGDPDSVYYSTLYGTLAGPPDTVLPAWLAWVLGILAVALVAGVLVLGLQRRQVGHRTRALAESQERTHALETRDRLTGLPNRQLFAELLRREVAEAARANEKLWLAMLDLDHFGVINETHGHETGESVLRQVGAIVEAIAGEGAVVARTGDDEFSVLVLPASLWEAELLAERLLDGVQSPFRVEGSTVVVGASVGLARFPEDGADAESLLSSAEAALRLAKRSGPGVFRYPSPQLTEEARDRVALRSALRHAVDHQELVLHYQPQIEASSGRIVGVEALVRWQHPERGLIPPGEFIELAEETGVIIAVGEWVLREACRQVHRWEEQGCAPDRTAVNISAAQLADTRFVSRVRAALEDGMAEAQRVELEITETVILVDRQIAEGSLEAVRRLGVHLSIDDFGTGYSSLGYLQGLPVDTLKVDMRFVRGMVANEGDATIVRAIIALGHSLGLRVVAEGVETVAQRDLLRAMDCDILQGYLFSLPVPVDVMTSLLERQVMSAG